MGKGLLSLSLCTCETEISTSESCCEALTEPRGEQTTEPHGAQGASPDCPSLGPPQGSGLVALAGRVSGLVTTGLEQRPDDLLQQCSEEHLHPKEPGAPPAGPRMPITTERRSDAWKRQTALSSPEPSSHLLLTPNQIKGEGSKKGPSCPAAGGPRAANADVSTEAHLEKKLEKT